MTDKPGTSGPPIDYTKVYMERVNIRFNAPEEQGDRSTGSELLHGYLCAIYRLRDQNSELADTIDELCRKWNIFYITG